MEGWVERAVWVIEMWDATLCRSNESSVVNLLASSRVRGAELTLNSLRND